MSSQASWPNSEFALPKEEMKMNVRSLIALICRRFFGDFTAFTDLVVTNFPSPIEAARKKIEHIYSGSPTSKLAQLYAKCDADGPLLVHTVKNYATEDATAFHVFGRELSVTLKTGSEIRILGDNRSFIIKIYGLTSNCPTAKVFNIFISLAFS